MLVVFLLAGCEPAQVSGGGGSPPEDTGTPIDTAQDTAIDPTDTADTAAPEDIGAPVGDWADFEASREDHLAALAAVIRACVPQNDTSWPVFHGCYDWHSAVHGVYALHAVYRLTGDTESLAVAESVLTEEAIAGELAIVTPGGPPGELPYGYAWLLALAIEREAATGSDDLTALAQAAAGWLEDWLTSLTEPMWIAAMRSDDYDNLSWAVLNLWRWAVWQGDPGLQAEAERHAEQLLLYDDLLPLALDAADTDDFFPPALHRVLAILTILPEETTAPWLDDFLPLSLELAPILDPSSAHQSGLNFSRAWGLWALYRATGDPAWRDHFAAHLQAHMHQPEYWAENYLWYSHWVPQFGVYAIAMSLDG